MRNGYYAQGKKLKRYRKSIKDVFNWYNMVRVCFSNRLFSCQVWWTHWRTRNWTVGDQLQQLKGDLRIEQGGGGELEGTDEKDACVLWVGVTVQGHDGRNAGRCILMGEKDSGRQAQPWPHRWADSPRESMGPSASLPGDVYQFGLFTLYQGSFSFPRSVQRGGIYPV